METDVVDGHCRRMNLPGSRGRSQPLDSDSIGHRRPRSGSRSRSTVDPAVESQHHPQNTALHEEAPLRGGPERGLREYQASARAPCRTERECRLPSDYACSNAILLMVRRSSSERTGSGRMGSPSEATAHTSSS